MSRFLLASLLPLAVLVGCGDPNGNGGNTECNHSDCDDTEFAATIHSVAPYGWVGDHRIFLVDENLNGSDCVDVNECDKLLDAYGNYRISLQWDTWDCVHQEIFVSETDDGETVSVSDAWTGEGVCSLAPNGTYSGYDVRTEIADFINGIDQMTIQIETWYAVITGTSFLYDGGGYYLEGTVSDDLSQIEFFAISGSGNETGGTINLED